jgi:dipeptidyl aminopeptidase/acylaminoacyl peptidase
VGAAQDGIDDRYGLREIVADDERLRRFQRFMDPSGLVVDGRVEPRWLADGSSFTFLQGRSHDPVVVRVDGRTGKMSRAALAGPAGAAGPRASTFSTAILSTYGVAAGDRYEPRPARRAKLFREFALVRETPSPDRRWYASVSQDGNVVLRSPLDDAIVPLTHDAQPRFGWDIEAPRSIWTAGLTLGERVLDPWSPEGSYLFAVKLDCRAVPDQPFIRYLKRDEECAWAKINRAGGPLDIAHPHVIDVLSRRARRLELGDTEDRYFTLVGWLRDGSEVVFTCHSRDFKTVDVLAGNPQDGTVRTILTESARTFVALQHDVIFSGDNHAAFMADGLVWRSSRSGWNHFYLYGLDGTLRGALTQGDFPAMDIVAVDEAEGWLYFTAHHDSKRPYDTHLCRVRLAGGPVERLTNRDGQNAISMSPSRKTFTVVNSRVDRPFSTDFHAADGTRLAEIEQADASALDKWGYVAPEEFTVFAADGKTELWGVMYRPSRFDPKKKYPVIDHLYGGPQVAKVIHRFDLGDNTQDRLDRALAELGYIVFSVDARGTPERSKAFQDAVYRRWGRECVADHVATMQQLAKRHAFIDLERAGIWGHSWGGYFTLRALATAPELYRAGVAVAPGLDPYDAILYEPYLDLPTRAREVYDEACLYPLAGSIRAKLLLVAGTADAMCYSNTIEMTHYLIQAGVDHELVVLPEATHYFEGRNDEYFVRKLATHFLRHLPPK